MYIWHNTRGIADQYYSAILWGIKINLNCTDLVQLQ